MNEYKSEIEVLYHDILNYKFSLIIGKGAQVKIRSINEIN